MIKQLPVLMLCISVGMLCNSTFGQVVMGSITPKRSLVLDLGAIKNQGVQLPNITDTVIINALLPPIGTIIFYKGGGRYHNTTLIRDANRWLPIWQGLYHSDNGWIVAGAINIGATAIAPVKPTVVREDVVKYRIAGEFTMETHYIFDAPNSTGSNRGAGDYIFSLPAGLKFDTVEHPIYRDIGVVQPVFNSNVLRFCLNPSERGVISQGNPFTDYADVIPVPITDSTFRLLAFNGTTIRHPSEGFIKAGLFSFDVPNKLINVRFKFKYRLL
jgi:hypothetical protein